MGMMDEAAVANTDAYLPLWPIHNGNIIDPFVKA
jgi:hypothetical protein